jgi:hypothetical protein
MAARLSKNPPLARYLQFKIQSVNTNKGYEETPRMSAANHEASARIGRDLATNQGEVHCLKKQPHI